MDDLVIKAMVKWPNVPDCYGWLGLDARGRWFMRDDAAQLAGHFVSGSLLAKGSELKHEKLIHFIERNYCENTAGEWYFQNGPQKVFVELQATPWIYRLDSQYKITTHTGATANFEYALLDEAGHLYLKTEIGVGLVHSQDVYIAAQAIEENGWELQEIMIVEMLNKFNIVQSPQQRYLAAL